VRNRHRDSRESFVLGLNQDDVRALRKEFNLSFTRYLSWFLLSSSKHERLSHLLSRRAPFLASVGSVMTLCLAFNLTVSSLEGAVDRRLIAAAGSNLARLVVFDTATLAESLRARNLPVRSSQATISSTSPQTSVARSDIADPAETYSEIADEFLRRGELEAAVHTLDTAIRLNPNSAELWNKLGYVHQVRGDIRRAISSFSQAIAINSVSSTLFNNRGYAYLLNGELPLAMADYERAISIDPKNAIAYKNRGWAYELSGDFEKAIADYDRAIKNRPLFADAYRSRGGVYQKKGLSDRAQADYEMAQRLQ
jgi:tetratricopeptide (TPR) repeat protein